jgi:prevent-host-death family protein
MTMGATPRRIPAAEFKARCLGLLDEVARTGVSLVITRSGLPVAKVVPADELDIADLRGSVLCEGDIVSPIDERWTPDS